MAQSQPLSPNEIRDRALRFAREWESERREKAEAQTFWNEFFNVFGISRRRVASFEEPVKHLRQRLETGDLSAKGGKGSHAGFIMVLPCSMSRISEFSFTRTSRAIRTKPPPQISIPIL